MVKIQKKNNDRSAKRIYIVCGVSIVLVIVCSIITSDETPVGGLLDVDPNKMMRNLSGELLSAGESNRVAMKDVKDASDVLLSGPSEGGVRSEPKAPGRSEAVSPEKSLEPIRCEEFLQKGYRKPGLDQQPSEALLNPNDDKLFARYTTSLEQKFWIAVHQESYDPQLFHSVHPSAAYNKTALSQAVIESIRTTPGRLLDIGAQIGWFALLARSMGMDVDVFDPIPANAFRICESLFVNKWSNYVEKAHPGPYVNVYNYAVLKNGKGDGSTTFRRKGATSGLFLEGEPFSTPVISLDEFVDRQKMGSTKISVLKISVEGLETEVIGGASKLLQSKTVQNILIPLPIEKTLDTILKSGYKLWKWGLQGGPDQDASNLPKDAAKLHTELSAKKEEEIYLWFRLL